MKSSVFNLDSSFSLSRQSQSQAGYSSSFKATGSSPDFLSFKLSTVPAGHEDCLAAADMEKALKPIRSGASIGCARDLGGGGVEMRYNQSCECENGEKLPSQAYGVS